MLSLQEITKSRFKKIESLVITATLAFFGLLLSSREFGLLTPSTLFTSLLKLVQED